MEARLAIINFFQRWMKSIDLISITLIVLLMILGLLFVTTASPNVAKLKSLNEFYFIKKHYLFAFFSIMARLCLRFEIASCAAELKRKTSFSLLVSLAKETSQDVTCQGLFSAVWRRRSASHRCLERKSALAVGSFHFTTRFRYRIS